MTNKSKAKKAAVVLGIAVSALTSSVEAAIHASVQKVSFMNAGIKIVGNLYSPPDLKKNTKYPAIIIIHPYGGVKEQTAGLYAERLAALGFITLAYDGSYWGESGGEPRNKEVPAARTEDVSRAVDYLSTLPQVDQAKIGVLGICGGGSYALAAAQIDLRIKATSTVSFFDLGRGRREGLAGSISNEQRIQRLQDIAVQRTKEANGEPVKYVPIVPDTLAEITDKTPTMYREGYEYYRTPRGQHANANNRQVFTAAQAQMAFFPVEKIETISPRPILLIVGEKADSRYFSEDALKKAKEPKEMFVVPNATHVDMYDKPQFVGPAVAKLKSFFDSYLK